MCAAKPSIASGVPPLGRRLMNDCGGRHAPPPSTSVHAMPSMGEPWPCDCVMTYMDDGPPTSVCFASKSCDGSRHERQRHGGAACEM